MESTLGRLEDFQTLNNNVWGTHIGRGNFTNFLLDMHMIPQEMKILRGDKNIESAVAYYCERNAIKNVNEKKELEIKDVDYSKIEQNWNRGVHL